MKTCKQSIGEGNICDEPFSCFTVTALVVFLVGDLWWGVNLND